MSLRSPYRCLQSHGATRVPMTRPALCRRSPRRSRRLADFSAAVSNLPTLCGGGPGCARFDLRNQRRRRQDCIGIERDAVDAALDKETRKVGIVARRLAAQANLAVQPAGLLDRLRHERADSLIPLVEEMSHERRIAIDAKRQLR